MWWHVEWTDAGSDEWPDGTVLRDAAGEVMRVSLGPGDVDCRPYYAADPDDWIVKAIVAAEDGTFWEHGGVRPLSALRAACQNIAGRRRVSGASTLTMQTVRLIRPHPKTLWWKVKEAVMAVKMERAKDKRWILSQYLNRAPYGANFVGIEAAAHGWFGKEAKQLGLGEAALLAGMVQAPSRFRPDRGYEKAVARRDYVLARMVATGAATEEQAAAARSVRPAVRRAPRPFRHPHFCDWALRTAGRGGEGGRTCGDFTTTLDADIQSVCARGVRAAAAQDGCPAAAVVLRVRDSAVVALACSGDYFDRAGGQVNTACAPRPAGSTLKPFLTALALDGGFAAPDTTLDDTPVVCPGYRPANFDARVRGAVTLRDALVLSLNIPFVRLLGDIGVPRFGQTLRGLGFAHLTAPDAAYGLGLAVGNAEVTLVELTAAYAALARGGLYRPPRAFAADGRRGDADGGVRVFSPGACWQVAEMLSGSARSAAALGHVADVTAARFAWKTGTSAAFRDAWTVAWNPEYVVGVWRGRLSGGFGDATVVGAKIAAPLAWRLARALYPGGEGPWFAKPPDADDVVTRAHVAAARRPARPSDARRLLKPADGETFRLAPGASRQTVVCRPANISADARLWWFTDGRAAGETRGDAPFAADLPPGEHTVTCAAVDGFSATARVTVAE